MHRVAQLTNDSVALAKIVIIFVEYVMGTMKLRSFHRGSLDVNKSVTSHLTKNFTAHLEWHTLMQISLLLQQQHKLQRQPTWTIGMN
jgi:hypothetical protein